MTIPKRGSYTDRTLTRYSYDALINALITASNQFTLLYCYSCLAGELFC